MVEQSDGVGDKAFGPVGGDGLRGAGDVGANLLSRLHQAAGGVELRLFAGFGGELGQLRGGVTEIVLFGAEGAGGLFGLRLRGAGGAEGGPGGAGGGKVVARGGEVVKDGAVAARVKQAAVVLLSVEFDQRVGEGLQLFGGGAGTVDAGGFAARGRDRAGQDQFVIHRDAIVGQDRAGGMCGREVKDGLDAALLGPVADKVRAAAPAKHKPQCVEQDGFASAGFTCQHVQPRLEIEVEAVDDEQVADRERAQHGRGSLCGHLAHRRPGS